MKFVTDNMRFDVRQAVRDLESVTSGEMVCAVSQSSARYVMFPLLWAALLALMLPVLNNVLPRAPISFGIQTGVFIVLAVVFLTTRFRIWLTPKEVREANCRRAAFEQFFRLKLHQTAQGTGVLLFVSVDEHYVELLADQGINTKVLPNEWDGVVDAFIGHVRAGKVHDGFVEAVKSCKTILAKHFPVSEGDKNELTDGLVELPESPFLS